VPKNNEIKSKWQETIIKNNLVVEQLSDNIRVCSKYFKNQCFKQVKNDGTSKNLLRELCIPSLFPKIQKKNLSIFGKLMALSTFKSV
jgi:hypothetical protein